ncbi:hypothetical protein ACOME3_004495 [Neoechinorhynchus agilis]
MRSDRKSGSPPAITKLAKVAQKVEETSERVGRRAKGEANNYKEMKSTSVVVRLLPLPTIPYRCEHYPSCDTLLLQVYKSQYFYDLYTAIQCCQHFRLRRSPVPQYS